MITFTLVVILGALLAMVFWKLFKKTVPVKAPSAAVPDLANLKIADARIGDTISVPGAGHDLSDLDFTIDDVTQCRAGHHEWIELSGPYRDRRVSLRATTSDEAEAATALDPAKLTLDDVGLNEDDLAAMDERQNTGDFFEFNGKPWHYRLSREISAYRNGGGQPVNSYGWEFLEEGGLRLMSVRKEGGEPFAATIYTKVHPGDITVYRGA
jgi:hypothetical protein